MYTHTHTHTPSFTLPHMCAKIVGNDEELDEVRTAEWLPGPAQSDPIVGDRRDRLCRLAHAFVEL